MNDRLRVRPLEMNCIALAVALGISAGAFAQDQFAGSAGPIEEVMVSASRVQRDGFSAPTPTQVVNAERLEVRGATNVGDVLNEMPAFRATVNPQSNGVRAISPGAVFGDLR